ncbi:hypothetical protein [Neorhizobium sp. S3-V5DH]|uniref:hypothetical protein n=1 Tax=Neorhizobium sp. S3-V5DH TaxID=2485166 RepID=UPI0010453EE5|nr:hypothetical protein [Neorhizobium sp. S3-V5DH]TCV62315.1 hypothetical protein EDE09_12480 [Neorhizobium sp. S3-V5DH]
MSKDLTLDIPKKPFVSEAIVSHLEEIFGVRKLSEATLNATDREIGAMVGEQRIIDYLRNLRIQQEEEGPLHVS